MNQAGSREPSRLVQLWADVLAQVLGEVSGSSKTCSLLPEAPSDLPAPGATDLWILIASTGALRGEMALRIPAASAEHLAQIFGSGAGAPSADMAIPAADAVIELFRQVSALAASAMQPAWGEVQLGLEATPAPPSWPASLIFWLRLDEEPGAFFVEVHLSAALAAALHADSNSPATPLAESPVPPTSPAAEPANEAVNLGLLMDVELELTLRFGSRHLLLREILELNPGSVLDLDRHIQDPIDMLLDGRIVARGEVVVIDGNYGLRVTEVPPRAVSS